MANEKTTSAAPAEDHGIGLLANGSSGNWSVDVDETTSGPDKWFLQIEGPTAYFSFEIPSRDTVAQTIDFLCRPGSTVQQSNRFRAESSCELVIGMDNQIPVRLIRDDEFDDRFFIMFGSVGGPLVRWTLSGDDLTDVVRALQQANEDISSEFARDS